MSTTTTPPHGLVATKHYAPGDHIGTYGSDVTFITDATHTYVAGLPTDTTINVRELQALSVTVYEHPHNPSTLLKAAHPHSLTPTSPERARDTANIKLLNIGDYARKTRNAYIRYRPTGPLTLKTHTVGKHIQLPRSPGGTMARVDLCALESITPSTHVTTMPEVAATCHGHHTRIITATPAERATAARALAHTITTIAQLHGFVAALNSIPYTLALNIMHTCSLLEPTQDTTPHAALLLSAILAAPHPAFSVTTRGLAAIPDGQIVTIHPLTAPALRIPCNVTPYHTTHTQRAAIKPQNLAVRYHPPPPTPEEAIACIHQQHQHIAIAIEPRPPTVFSRILNNKSKPPPANDNDLPKTCAACAQTGIYQYWFICPCGLARYCSET